MPNLKQILWVLLSLNLSLIASDVKPMNVTVNLMKNCEVLMLNEKRDRESKLIFTFAGKGDCIQKFECLRNISQKELDNMATEKRQYAKWKNPIWCKVMAGEKKGWVEEQFLSDEPCELEE